MNWTSEPDIQPAFEKALADAALDGDSYRVDRLLLAACILNMHIPDGYSLSDDAKAWELRSEIFGSYYFGGPETEDALSLPFSPLMSGR